MKNTPLTITSELIIKTAKHLGEDVTAEYYSKEAGESDLLKWIAEKKPNLTPEYMRANTYKIEYRVILSRYTGGYWIIKSGEKSTTQTFNDVFEGETSWFTCKIAYVIERLNPANYRAQFQSTRYNYNQVTKANEKQSVEIKRLKLDLTAKNKGFKNHSALLKEKYEGEIKAIMSDGFKRNQAVAIKENSWYAPDLKDLFAGKIQHPNGYTGSGRHIKVGTNHVANLGLILRKNKVKYETGNDAPKGGFSGMWIKIIK